MTGITGGGEKGARLCDRNWLLGQAEMVYQEEK